MNEIWANRLIAGTQTWEKCIKTGRFLAVKEILKARTKNKIILPEQFKQITGEDYFE